MAEPGLPERGLLEKGRRFTARILFRLLAFNVLLVFVPAAGFLYLDTYEQQLLDAQERAMVEQGRVLAAALADHPELTEEDARTILLRLDRRVTARLRVLGPDGRLLADSSTLGKGPGSPEPGADGESYAGELSAGGSDGASAAGAGAGGGEGAADVRSSWIYRLGAGLYRWFPGGGRSPGAGRGTDFYASDRPFEGSEVRAALEGRYGAATRVTPEQRSLTLYSALPVIYRPAAPAPPPVEEDEGGVAGGESEAVEGAGEVEGGVAVQAGDQIGGDERGAGERVTGVVLVSQSTLRLLQDLYEVRLAVFRVFLASVAVAVLLSLLVAGTIVRPVRRLRRQAAALLDRRGRLTGRFGGSRRRDEIGDLARSLERLSRRLGRHLSFLESFAADVSHEFKNPLAGIRSASEMLADSETPEERRRWAGRIQNEVARLEGLLTDVRDLTTLDAGLGEEDRETVDLGQLASNVAEAFRMRGARQPIEVTVFAEAEGEAVRVEASPDRLVQVLENLLDNALSLSPPDAAVEVTVEARDGRARVTVADRGPGIPKENLPRIFDRFFSDRPAPASGSTPGGIVARRSHSGLGLAIVRAVVDGYGGRVWAEPRPQGGTRVIFSLPPAGSARPDR